MSDLKLIKGRWVEGDYPTTELTQYENRGKGKSYGVEQIESWTCICRSSVVNLSCPWMGVDFFNRYQKDVIQLEDEEVPERG